MAGIGVVSIAIGVVGALAVSVALSRYRSGGKARDESTRRIVTVVGLLIAIGFAGMAIVGVIQIALS